jgi:hypothetical protein
MAIGALNIGSYKNATSTGNVSPRAGALLGFYVNSTSSGTIVLYDSATTTTTTVISGTITPAIGWHSFPVGVANGIYAVIGGTLNVTFVFA